MGILLGLAAREHLKRSAFDHSNLFQIKKRCSVNIEHQPVCTKSMELKEKWFRSNDYLLPPIPQ